MLVDDTEECGTVRGMFKDKTVLILGAGASRPYGSPTSGELRQLLLGIDTGSVLDKLQPRLSLRQDRSPRDGMNVPIHHLINEDMKAAAYNETTHLDRFRQQFRLAERVSIDAFINGLPPAVDGIDMAHIARSSVAAILLRLERHAALTGDWYQWLLEFLLRDGRDFPIDRLTVITFNYDRSLERYLDQAFEHSFRLKPEEARAMRDRIKFIHVYGSLGDLNEVGWGDVGSQFGAAAKLALATPRIEEERKNAMRKALANAQRVIFMGFAFWKENLDVLHDNHERTGSRTITTHDLTLRAADDWFRKKVFASRYGLWETTRKEVTARFGFIRDLAKDSRSPAKIAPLIQWGEEHHDLWKFVTTVDLNE